nr:MAG TPA: hypothetical protein [Caudoviricetes sp.]
MFDIYKKDKKTIYLYLLVCYNLVVKLFQLERSKKKKYMLKSSKNISCSVFYFFWDMFFI